MSIPALTDAWRKVAVVPLSAGSAALVVPTVSLPATIALGATAAVTGGVTALLRHEAMHPFRRAAASSALRETLLPAGATVEDFRKSLGSMKVSSNLLLPKAPRSGGPALKGAREELARALDFRTQLEEGRIVRWDHPGAEALGLRYDTSALVRALRGGELDGLDDAGRAWVQEAVLKTLGLEKENLLRHSVVGTKLKLPDGRPAKAYVNVESVPVIDALERYRENSLTRETSRTNALLEQMTTAQSAHAALNDALAERMMGLLDDESVRFISRQPLREQLAAQALSPWRGASVPPKLAARAQALVENRAAKGLAEEISKLTDSLRSARKENAGQLGIAGGLEKLRAALTQHQEEGRASATELQEIENATRHARDAMADLRSAEGSSPMLDQLSSQLDELLARALETRLG